MITITFNTFAYGINNRLEFFTNILYIKKKKLNQRLNINKTIATQANEFKFTLGRTEALFFVSFRKCIYLIF